MPGKILVIGFGNPAREDDGLGPAVAELVEKAGITGVTVDIDYQLSVEHAADAAQYETVVFVDASIDGAEPFDIAPVTGVVTESFSSHSVVPEQVIGLSESLFSKSPKGYVLGIRGYSFEMFKEDLTEKGRSNMNAAADWLIRVLEKGNIEEAMGERT